MSTACDRRYTMKIVICKTGKKPEYREIDREDLQVMQEIVEGWIEVVYLSDVLCLVCNDEGAINGMPLNRIILNERIDGTPLGALNIHGNFFVCQYDGPDLTSIPKTRIDLIMDAMANPVTYLDAAWHRRYIKS